MLLAKDDRFIPIGIEFEPKMYIRIELLLLKSGIGVPLLVHIVRPSHVVHHL
jgi:hypothetical protein